MSVTDQLQAVLSSVSALEKSLADSTANVAVLTGRVKRLTDDNAALREKLGEGSPPSPVLPPVVPPTPVDPGPVDPTPTPGPTPGPVDPPPAVTATEWGFAANDGDPSAGFAPAFARMKADGGEWLRLWHSNFGTISHGNASLIAAARAAGIKVVLCLQPKDAAPEPLGKPDFTTFVAVNEMTLRNVAYVEVGNELNLMQYRPDDFGGNAAWPAAYVDRWLKPLAAALKAVGVKTLCTSITDTYHPENYRPNYDALLAAGAADCCDGVAIHAYALPQNLAAISALIGHLKATWAKPVFVTECNVLTRGLTPAQWQNQFPPYVAMLRAAGVAAIQFYRGFPKSNGKWSWPTLFDAKGRPTTAYDLLLKAMTA